MTTVLQGRDLATSIRSRVADGATALRASGTTPKVAIVVATDEESTLAYVRSLVGAAESTGIEANVVVLASDSGPGDVRAALRAVGGDPSIHGVLLQTPLPVGVRASEVSLEIPATKDVDGANPLSLGRLSSGLPAFAPATARAVIELLREHGIALAGRAVTVVGRSTVVGKPLAQLLLEADATVTVCHSKTPDLAAVTRAADVVVAAAGRAHLLGRDHIGKGSVVIDVGTNFTAEGPMVGDVDAEALDGHAAAVSPVPGGVGPVTTAVLLQNVVTAAGGGSPPG
jgi:methylenetetrahydrofolate dehydrogenase (NADP+) / methenyltetrahydrofolate cyclohydrolase